VKQFLRFCVVGAAGFLVDAGILQTLVAGLGLNPYASRLVSFLAAATATWWMNRHYTFVAARKPSRAEWQAYVGLMVLGALINYGAFALCIAFWRLALAQPWLAVAVGSVAGLGVNFSTSRLFFRRTDGDWNGGSGG
jgi:putative flippase GtrA